MSLKKALHFIAGISLFALSACATGPVNLGMPMNRLDSPEAYGAFGAGRVDIGHRSTHKVNLTPDYGTTLISSNTHPSIESVADYGYDFGLGLLSFADFDVHENSDAQGYPELRVQVLGKNRREAKPGNFSLSLVGAFAGNVIRSGMGYADYSLFGTPTGGAANYQLQSNYAHLGLVTGYRFSSSFLTYGGFTDSWVTYSGNQTTLDGSTSRFYGKIKQKLYSVGILYMETKEPDRKDTSFFRFSSGFVQLEGDLSSLDVNGETKTQPNGSINVGLMW